MPLPRRGLCRFSSSHHILMKGGGVCGVGEPVMENLPPLCSHLRDKLSCCLACSAFLVQFAVQYLHVFFVYFTDAWLRIWNWAGGNFLTGGPHRFYDGWMDGMFCWPNQKRNNMKKMCFNAKQSPCLWSPAVFKTLKTIDEMQQCHCRLTVNRISLSSAIMWPLVLDCRILFRRVWELPAEGRLHLGCSRGGCLHLSLLFLSFHVHPWASPRPRQSRRARFPATGLHSSLNETRPPSSSSRLICSQGLDSQER